MLTLLSTDVIYRAKSLVIASFHKTLLTCPINHLNIAESMCNNEKDIHYIWETIITNKSKVVIFKTHLKERIAKIQNAIRHVWE